MQFASALNIGEIPSAPDSTRRSTAGTTLSKANKYLSIFLLAIIALSPIPAGSNLPIFWGVSALCIAVAGICYALYLQIANITNLRFPLRRVRLPLILFALVLGFLTLQIIPFSAWIIVSADGQEIVTRTLSVSSGDTVLMLLRQLSYGMFFFMVLQVGVNTGRAEKMLQAIFIIVTVHAIYAMVALTQLGDVFLLGDKEFYRGVATGTFINRNSFATFLAMGAVAGLSVVLGEITLDVDKRARIQNGFSLEKAAQVTLRLLALGIILSTIIATQSRMGIFSALAGLIVVGALVTGFARPKNTKLFSLGLIGALIVLALMTTVFGAGLFERLGSVDRGIDVRGQLYVQIFEMIKARPFAGFGGGSFELAYPLFHETPVSFDLVWDKAHSTYLALWSELGIIFGSLLLIILAIFVWQLVALLRARTSRSLNTLAGLGALTVVSLHSLVDFSLEMQANTYLFLAILGLGLAGTASRHGTRAPTVNGPAAK